MKGNLHKVDRYLTNYYQLSDEGRDEVDRYIEYLPLLKAIFLDFIEGNFDSLDKDLLAYHQYELKILREN